MKLKAAPGALLMSAEVLPNWISPGWVPVLPGLPVVTTTELPPSSAAFSVAVEILAPCGHRR